MNLHSTENRKKTKNGNRAYAQQKKTTVNHKAIKKENAPTLNKEKNEKVETRTKAVRIFLTPKSPGNSLTPKTIIIPKVQTVL